MTKPPGRGAYGMLVEPTTLKIERLLPGPIERIWEYLTDDDLRRQWLAAGKMEPKVGADFELVWRNDQLTTPAGQRPPGFPEEHRMQSRVVAIAPPRRLVIAWGEGDVSFELVPEGPDVRLTVVHRRLLDRVTTLRVAAGWHMHLDILVTRASSQQPEPFWDGWLRLRNDYDQRLPT